jgi:hypothetical protein
VTRFARSLSRAASRVAMRESKAVITLFQRSISSRY